MAPPRIRMLLRLVHLIGSGFLGTYLYSPWSTNRVFAGAILYVVFPLMAGTGIWMWQQGRIARALGR